MSSETDLLRNQTIQNQRNSFSLAFQRGNATSIRGTFPDSALLYFYIVNQKCYVLKLINYTFRKIEKFMG
jgi:hypothetical protein